MRYIRNVLFKITNYFNYIEKNMKFIWGISSCSGEASMYQLNDIDIVYDKKIKKYMLGVETAFLFESKEKECNYLEELLQAFHDYMVSQNLSVTQEHVFFFSDLTISFKTDSIEELYINFSIFVKGYCALYKEEV